VRLSEVRSRPMNYSKVEKLRRDIARMNRQNIARPGGSEQDTHHAHSRQHGGPALQEREEAPHHSRRERQQKTRDYEDAVAEPH
jgi:hypothetical protein